MYRVRFTREALKNFKKVDPRYKGAVSKAIDKIRNDPEIGFPLKGKLKGYWKLRFSRYRIIYRIIKKQLIILVLSIKHRKDVYKRY